MNKNIHDNALLVHLTVNEMKEVLASTIQQLLSKTNNQSEIIGIEEVLKLTGYKKATVYKLIHERKIPFHKPAHGGRRVFFKSTEVDQWLQSNRIGTNEEFLQNSRNKKSRTNNKIQRQQKLSRLKSLLQLFIMFSNIINKYKAQIQELEETVAKYEKDNQMIENLFNDNIINTIQNENNKG